MNSCFCEHLEKNQEHISAFPPYFQPIHSVDRSRDIEEEVVVEERRLFVAYQDSAEEVSA